jgi:cyclophilin family peptidyl-prolyl cis-trans isomerase
MPSYHAAAESSGQDRPTLDGPRRHELTNARDYATTEATIKTTQGDMTVRFFWKEAPGHVKNFVDLAESGFYDGTIFHRVIPGFMIQGGDPQTKDPKVSPSRYGTGGNTDASGREVRVKAEFSALGHRRGILSMARSSDPNSASSQFFVVVKDSPFLDRQYTVFGEVVSGIEVADKIVSESKPNLGDPSGGRPAAYQKITSITLS